MEAVLNQNTLKVTPASARKIKKVAVLGSGVMGSRIACHFAGIGCQVVLLDIIPKDTNDAEKAKGLTLDSKSVRNRIANDALQFALKSKPSPIFSQSLSNRISTGNFEDDMKLISDCDWVIEVVIENLNIKKSVYEKVENHRRPGTLITSNTSGIPIHLLSEGRSEDFKAHFAGTHFFNPPRYLQLLEIIPTPSTHNEVTNFLMQYGDIHLGKTTVLCKDTPAFIANRIGVFSIMTIFHLMQEMKLTIEEVDALTGPATGRPSSATFRTCDVVGLDTLVKVANGLYDNCPNDESRNMFKIPEYVSKMVENNWIGDKSGQGFYKKVKAENGSSKILALNVNTLEYTDSQKIKFASIEAGKNIDNLQQRLKVIYAANDKGALFLNQLSATICQYISNRIPEIADEIYKVDDAVKAGFGWELGPFEQWDLFGVAQTIQKMEAINLKPAAWVYEMLNAGCNSFYKVENGKKQAYNPKTKTYETISNKADLIILDNYSKKSALYKNTGAALHDIGDGVLCLEWHTKMNTLGGDVLEAIQKSIDIAEKQGWKGLILANEGANFSAGANLAMIFMMAIEQEYDELDFAVQAFQQTVMRIRYSSIPVIVAPHNMTLGGGCEMTMHSDKAIANAETYIGLVEIGVGILPAGGGTKECALRASDAYFEGDVQIPSLQKYLMNIATAKVATSAHEAFEMGILRKGIDEICFATNRRIAEAKKAILTLHQNGYTQPPPRKDIKALGRSALGTFYSGIAGLQLAGYATEHDAYISRKIAYVLCGGDLSTETLVSEQYLLDLEREAFLHLCGMEKTLKRMEAILKNGKPLRN